MHLRRWTSLLWTASLLTLTGSQASAQTLFQRRPGGELGLSAVGRSTSTAGRTGLRTLAYRQWLSLPFWGSIVHPRLFQYSLLLAPSFRQEDTKGAESLTIARDLGVNLTAQLLPEMPLSATVAFLRSSGDADGSNSEGSYRQRALTGIVSFQNAYFPMTLRVGEQRWRSEWSDPVVPLPFMQRYVNRSMRLSGSSRRLEVLWEQTSHDDQVGQEDFEGSVLQARHNLEWGKGSRLSTTWGRNQRLGSNPFDRRTWVQGLQLQHTEGISSRFQLQRITTGGPEVSTSSTRFYGYTFQARISPAFSGSFGASLHRTSFGSTQDRGFEFGPRLTFRTNLPAEVVLTAGASTNYESRERTDGGEGDVQAFDEPHKIDETRRAVLDNLDALIETVVVRSADGVTLYADGVDYRLVPVGSQVDIIVLADGRITIGETLLISYRYRVPIELPAKAVQSGLDLMFRRGSVSFTQSVMRRWALGSDGAYGGDALDWMSSLAFTRELGIGQLTVDLSRREQNDRARNAESLEATAKLLVPYSRTLRGTLSGSIRRTRDNGSFRSRNLQAQVHWTLSRRMQLRGSLQYWDWDIQSGTTERTIQGSWTADIRFNALSIEAGYELQRRASPLVNLGSGFRIRLVRRF